MAIVVEYDYSSAEDRQAAKDMAREIEYKTGQHAELRRVGRWQS